MTSAPFPRHLLLDGGLATLLVYEFGLTAVNDDPLWGSRQIQTASDVIKYAHLKFLGAGCDVIETATYQASIDGFVRHLGLTEGEAVELMRKGARLACEARDEFWQQQQQQQQDQQPEKACIRPLVAASIGPYGAHQCDGSEYTGNYVDSMSEEELMAWHRPQVSVLTASGVDMLAFDTVPAAKEAKAIATLLEQDFRDVKAWVSFSCKDARNVCHGETFASAAETLLSSQQIFGIGINCTAPEYVTPLLRSLSAQVKAQKLIIVYPNSGEMWSEEKSWHQTSESTSLASCVVEWLSEGAAWIGGCCRIGSNDLTEAKKELRKYCNKRN